MLAEANRQASALIRAHQVVAEAVARWLLEHRELGGSEFESLFCGAIDDRAPLPIVI